MRCICSLSRDYNYRARLLPFDAIQSEQKMNMSIIRRSRVVVVSQSNRNCDTGFSDCISGVKYRI